jgi:hypothetical protein|tara:strand:- start:7403 stop:7978 length:576 start_codon:yes stop_codon:yes gene_type:complete
MAIDTGLGIVCADLQATGGISQILIREWVTADVITYGASTAHTITNIQSGGDAAWFLYEFKNETPALTIAATKENGSTAFECGLSFMLPRLDAAKMEELKNFENACMMGLALDTNGKWWVLGVSSKYANEDVAAKSQTFLNLSGFEGGTGAAYSDESGLTVNMMSRQFELPREYTGTVTVNTSALTATTGA